MKIVNAGKVSRKGAADSPKTHKASDRRFNMQNFITLYQPSDAVQGLLEITAFSPSKNHSSDTNSEWLTDIFKQGVAYRPVELLRYKSATQRCLIVAMPPGT